jgi:hypothetical protein
MKIGEWGKKVSVAVGVIIVLTCMGCSVYTEDAPEPDADLPTGLGLMQGAWEFISTNGFADHCRAIIDGYNIRLRYQDSPDSPLVRQSTVIDSINEQQQVLMVNEGIGAGPYFYGTKDGLEHLELEFFSQYHKEWRRVRMRRSLADG